MQNKYPSWKYILLIVVTILSLIYSLPNLYSEDPAVQITGSATNTVVTDQTEKKVRDALIAHNIESKSIEMQDEDILIRFPNTDTQLKARDIIKDAVGNNYTVALNLAPSTPKWMESIGATPMKQGLDLRGGVHFLLDVDIDSVMQRRIEGMMKNITTDLREERIRYAGISPVKGQGFVVRFRDAQARDQAYNIIRRSYSQLLIAKQNEGRSFRVTAQLSPAELNTIRQNTIDQTMSILRNRVNELGVGEAVVQQQGATRIAVDLPGIQDAARAKQILGGTATLEFHMVDSEHDPSTVKATGIVPVGTRLYDTERGPLLLKREVVLSGDSITSAVSSYDAKTATPAVNIQLGGGGSESIFSRTTRANIGKRMAIVYVETKVDSKLVNDKVVRTSRKEERVISAPVIQSALGNNFQITGLTDGKEARNLALLLRAGALPAAIDPVEERTVGPTLGKENIQRGLFSLQLGMMLILAMMIVYYRVFGLIANVALILNLIFLVAILSIIDNTLTLPGMAAIILTVGMAVDANVLIYERIREEIRNGASPQAAIFAGYERAFSTIVDANVTTLIVAIILFAIGTGPIRGFAVVLAIGLLTSMLTAITFTRAIVNLTYGRRSVKKLSIGI